MKVEKSDQAVNQLDNTIQTCHQLIMKKKNKSKELN